MMKMKNVVLLLVGVLFLVQGCIPSLYPLYTADKLVMKSEIVGRWINQEHDASTLNNLIFSEEGIPSAKDAAKGIPEVWIFTANDDKSYSLVYYDDKVRIAGFDAHLVRLGDDYFFNFYPRDIEEGAGMFEMGPSKFNDLEWFHYYPVNTFAKVTFEEGSLSLALFDADFLEKLLDQNRIRIKHEKTQKGYILTAQPEELQKFILKYADEEKAFPEPMTLGRPI